MQFKKILTLFLVTGFFYANSALAAVTDWSENQSKGAKTRLIGSFYLDDSGKMKLIAGLHFKLADGWKIYGPRSEGIGMPPSVDFAGSKNYVGHEIIWPTPITEEEKIGEEILTYTTYHDEVIIPIEVDFDNAEENAELVLALNYGLCKDICVPASEKFTLKISGEPDVETLNDIQKFYQKNISDDLKKTETPKKSPNSLTLVSAILLAIFGGAILNIMPCVLPVLSIKLMSIIKHSDAAISRIRFAFLATTLGILSCFVFFAILASAIKITGNSLGWGLQFQNPYFLIFLIITLILFIGNLLGIFEISFDRFFSTFLNAKINAEEKKKNIFIPNFLSGILAVLLATPCSAPFLGSAISFALVQNYSVIFIIFTFIGIGFALPYLILLISPKLVHFLPKPGEWMLQVKQLMAGLLAATVIWLVYVLSHNIGALPAFLAGALSISLLLCIRIKSSCLKYIALAIIIATAFALPIDWQKRQKATDESYSSMWRTFDEAEIYRQVSNGKVVVVDITADWCLTCKFNKVRVFHDKEVMAKLKGGDIIALRGDITKPNEEIMKYLRKNNRFAIPFNAVYGPNAKTGLLTSELLSKKELFELIEKAEAK